MAAITVPLEVPVGDLLECDGAVSIRGWAVLPASNLAFGKSLVYCIPGGGCSTSYFDLQVEGLSGYSMAQYLSDRGVVVVAFDHPGIGASDQVPDRFTLTPSLVARCHDRAICDVREQFRSGRLASELQPVSDPNIVGLGHSMGGLISVVQQGVFRSFDSLVILGHSGFGLPEVLTEAELHLTADQPDLFDIEDQIKQLARTRFTQASVVPRKKPERGVFFAEDVPQAVRQAFAGQAVPLLFSCGLASMIPRSAGVQAASIDVPVFLGFGDQDLVSDRYGALAPYASASYATVFLLGSSGHCHNQASSRAQLWERILSWISHVALRLGPPDQNSVADVGQ